MTGLVDRWINGQSGRASCGCWRAVFGAGRDDAGSSARIGFWPLRRPVVGDGVQRVGLAHALTFVIDDHSPGGALALKADLDGALGQVARSFKSHGLEGEGVVSPHVAVFLDKEQFVIGFIGRQEADAVAVQGEAVQGRHAQDGVDLGIVLFFNPLNELAIEALQGGEVQLAGEELVTDGPEEAFDFSFGGTVAHGRVGQEAADPGADLDDFLGGVDGAVIYVQRGGHAPLVESSLEGLNERIDVFGLEELAVTTDPRSVIEEGNETSLDRNALGLDVRAVEGVGLPHLVGVGFGEGQADFVGALCLGFENSKVLTSR